jgi:hypothetical protein
LAETSFVKSVPELGQPRLHVLAVLAAQEQTEHGQSLKNGIFGWDRCYDFKNIFV